jgi:steroid 5-alpha reductase family enzyme
MIGFWISLFVLGFIIAGAVYCVALRLQLMAMVDVVWTAGLGLATLAYLLFSESQTPRAYVVTLFITFWSFRLSYHLITDRVLRGEEDPRYENLARYWGTAAKRNFLGLFLVQVLLVALFLWPVSIAMTAEGAQWLWSDWLAVAIALLSFAGETIADRQLAHFRSNPAKRGEVCRDGLWRYSRHPNYFFEWLHWWAYVAFALNSTWWWALIGPAAMYVFLRYLTGIPHAERSSLKSRGEGYRRYQQTTNAFFPWLPREPLS